MSDAEADPPAPTVTAKFSSAAEMKQAIDTLVVNGFEPADLALVDTESGGDPFFRDSIDTSAMLGEPSAPQVSPLHATGAATAAGLAAAGITVATGGLAAIAVGAAVVAAAAVGGLAHAVNTAANHAETLERDSRAADGRLVLSVQVPTAGRRVRAETILQDAGAFDISEA